MFFAIFKKCFIKIICDIICVDKVINFYIFVTSKIYINIILKIIKNENFKEIIKFSKTLYKRNSCNHV